MEKQELNTRKEAWEMALIKLAIPLSLIAYALAKAKIKIKFHSNPTAKKTDNINKPMEKPIQKPIEEPTNDQEKNDREEAKRRAIFCFGTAKIFGKRRKTIGFFNKLIKYFGLLVFLSLSLLVSAEDPFLINVFKSVTFVFNVILLVFSLWALIFDWDNRLENFSEAISKNMQYFRVFKEIKERYNEDKTKYANLLTETKLLDDLQQEKDYKENFSAKECRFIMREGLYQLQLKCVVCGKIPNIANPEKCDNCGK